MKNQESLSILLIPYIEPNFYKQHGVLPPEQLAKILVNVEKSFVSLFCDHIKIDLWIINKMGIDSNLVRYALKGKDIFIVLKIGALPFSAIKQKNKHKIKTQNQNKQMQSNFYPNKTRFKSVFFATGSRNEVQNSKKQQEKAKVYSNQQISKIIRKVNKKCAIIYTYIDICPQHYRQLQEGASPQTHKMYKNSSIEIIPDVTNQQQYTLLLQKINSQKNNNSSKTEAQKGAKQANVFGSAQQDPCSNGLMSKIIEDFVHLHMKGGSSRFTCDTSSGSGISKLMRLSKVNSLPSINSSPSIKRDQVKKASNRNKEEEDPLFSFFSCCISKTKPIQSPQRGLNRKTTSHSLGFIF